ncbi:hypothetical protein [Exiguobacterium sp. SL-10]|uniref:hypothetical protein n=1 Tax=Exiguobacterium sp. SL-10 TaxID=2510962 RepID=UPI001375D2DE|nr:hypothetical protein [Exiguobacterium sp. SL-10]
MKLIRLRFVLPLLFPVTSAFIATIIYQKTGRSRNSGRNVDASISSESMNAFKV